MKKWLAENYDNSVKSVSFLLHANHNFPLPPYEEITEDEYNKIFKEINFSVPLSVGLTVDELTFDECSTGSCPIK
jgi:hypothetical protein